MKALSIRRILVALDASSSCAEGVKTAGDLATRLGAELAGLFVEDIDLLRAAAFPFVRECGYLGTGVRRIEPDQLEGQLRVQAERMRKILEETASERKLPCHFSVIRGSVARELISAGMEADLIIMGRSGRSLLGPGHLGSAAREVIARRRGSTLILHQKSAKPDYPMVVYDGTAAARKALGAATLFMADEAMDLRIFLLADTKEQAEAYREEVNQVLKTLGRRAKFRLLISSSPSVIAHFVNLESTGLLLLPGERWYTDVDELIELVTAIEGTVLVVE